MDHFLQVTEPPSEEASQVSSQKASPSYMQCWILPPQITYLLEVFEELETNCLEAACDTSGMQPAEVNHPKNPDSATASFYK